MTTHALLERSENQTGYRLSTARQSFLRIRRGEDPWVALGDFLDDWRRATSDQRALLVAESIPTTRKDPERRWAALFASVVDLLSYRADSKRAAPDWVADDVYVLPVPWFVIDSPSLREWQLAESPAPFRMRRIYTDESIIARA